MSAVSVVSARLRTPILRGVAHRGCAHLRLRHRCRPRRERQDLADPPGPTSTRACLTKGGNYLIIGSDTRAFVDSQKDAEHFGDKATQTGQRSDTIMVAHIDPGKHTGILVSFPRDLWVEIPGHGTREDQCRVRVRRSAARDHDDRAGLRHPDQPLPRGRLRRLPRHRRRDRHVPIYFPTPARDKNTGLDDHRRGLPQPCRATRRSPTCGRATTSTKRPTASGTPTRPPTSAVSSASSTSCARWRTGRGQGGVPERHEARTACSTRRVASLTSDKELGKGDLFKLVHALRNTDPNAFPMFTLPATNAFRDSQSVLLLDAAQAAPMLRPPARTRRRSPGRFRRSRRRRVRSTSRTARVWRARPGRRATISAPTGSRSARRRPTPIAPTTT